MYINKKYALISLPIFLAACAAPLPPQLNTQGQPITFANPVIGKKEMDDARFVLLEKSIADGQYKVVSISKTRQPITNERQERIVFNKDVTKYSADFSVYSFQTYVDNNNYREETVVMKCMGSTLKVVEYSPCSSNFRYVFVPTGVEKSYVAGQMSMLQHNRWTSAELNQLRGVRNPYYALKQAGIFERIQDVVSAK